MTRTPRRKLREKRLGEIAAAAYDVPLNSQGEPLGRRRIRCAPQEWSIIDGSGNPWVSGDIAILGDRIAAIRKLERAREARDDAKAWSWLAGLLTCGAIGSLTFC